MRETLHPLTKNWPIFGSKVILLFPLLKSFKFWTAKWVNSQGSLNYSAILTRIDKSWLWKPGSHGTLLVNPLTRILRVLPPPPPYWPDHNGKTCQVWGRALVGFQEAKPWTFLHLVSLRQLTSYSGIKRTIPMA